MQTEWSANPSVFGQVEGRPVVAAFDGGALSGVWLPDGTATRVGFLRLPKSKPELNFAREIPNFRERIAGRLTITVLAEMLEQPIRLPEGARLRGAEGSWPKPELQAGRGNAGRNSPVTLSRFAFNTRQTAANVSPPTTVNPPSGGRPAKSLSRCERYFAASISVRPAGRAGRTTQHPSASSTFRTRPSKPELAASARTIRAAPRRDLDLTNGYRVARADNHEMRFA